MMIRARSLCAAIALGASLLCAAGTQAATVNFTTIGTFTGGEIAGSSTYLDTSNPSGVVQITFNNAINNSVTVPPASTASFGQFDTSGTTTSTFSSVSSGFTLDIFQSDAPGVLTFVGSLTGQLRMNNSQAYVQFTGPLSGVLVGTTTGPVSYSIISADDNTPGRISISAATSNNGLTTVSGRISLVAVPEPSSLALVGLGLPLLVAYRIRRHRTAATV